MNGIAQFSNPLWQSMCFFAFAFLVFSWVQAHKNKIDIFSSTRYMVFLLALLAVISFSKPLFITGTALINDEAEQVSTSIEVFLDNTGRTAVEGEDSTFAIAAPIMGMFLDIAHYLASLVREILGYFQWGVIFLLYSVSPLLLAFLSHPNTQNIGVRFLTTSFAVMMWKFGFIFADMIFIGSFDQIVASYVTNPGDQALKEYTVGSVAADVSLSLGLAAWLFIMLILLALLYFLAPLLVHLIFSGASPAGAVGAAIGSVVAAGAGFSRMAASLQSSRRSLATSVAQTASGSSSGTAAKPGGAGAIPALSSGMSSIPMMGLPAGEVSQREQDKSRG